MNQVSLVYLAAGISSRFGGALKQFAKIGPHNQTLIEYSLEQALKSPFSEIIFIVGAKTKKPIKEKFGHSYKGIPIRYAYQTYNKKNRDKPWGTADALSKIKINNPFVLCNSDDIYGPKAFSKLHGFLQKSTLCATVGYPISAVLPKKGNVNRGILRLKNNLVSSIDETLNISQENSKKLSKKTLCSMNIFGLQVESLEKIKKKVDEFKEKNKGNRTIESVLSTELSGLINKKKIVMKALSTNEDWYGVTNPEDEKEVRMQILKKVKC